MLPLRNDRWALALVMLLAGTVGARAQCNNDNTLIGSAITVSCPGTTTVPCIQGGQYVLVNVVSGNIYTFSTCSGSSFDTEITVYPNPSGTSLAFNDDACGLQSSVQWTSTLTGQVRVLVDQFPCANNTTCIPLTISCAAPPPPVTNNNPCQAIAVPVNSTCMPSTYSNVGANLTTTPVIPAPGCGNLVAGSADVWFTFVAPASGIATIETGAGTLSDGAIALYTATSCSGTYNLVQCNDDGFTLMPFLTFNNLTPGQTYYIRFWGYGTATGTFTLCIHGPTSIPAGNCVYLLQLYDAYGDGWDGSTVTITVNGSPYGTYTCNTFYNAFLIGVNIGQVLVVQYSGTGSFQGDNQYTLSFLSTNQVVYNSGSPPPTGVVYTQTITCNPPPAAQEDCVGGFTICSSQGINNNTNNTGSVADLNPSNYGCLLSSEQQGTWYNFSVTSSGTLGMVLDPSDADANFPDYDWAIWGPYPPGSSTNAICPPLGTPIRCSYASGYDSYFATGGFNTGMGINNTAWANPQYAAPLPAYSDPAGGGDGWTPGLNVTAGQVYLLYISNYSNTGQSFSLTWQLGAGASLDCTVLPLELLSFGAAPANDGVHLQWATASELNTARFEVERAGADHAFIRIGTVAAQGNSATTVQYALLDPTPLPGVNYYHVTEVDQDGARYVSPDAAVDVRSCGRTARPFPDPASSDVWWMLPDGVHPDRVVLFDLIGRPVLTVRVGTQSGGPLHVDVSALPEGAYVLGAFTGDGAVFTAPLLKR